MHKLILIGKWKDYNKSMLEQLLNQFPPMLVDARGNMAYLTIGACHGYWQVCYMNDAGDPVNSLVGEGVTIFDSLKDLLTTIELQQTLAAPAVPVDELTGELKHDIS